MAALVTIGGNGSLFVGEDKSVRLEVLDTDGVPVDLTGWAVRFLVLSQSGSVLIDETAAITGVYSATRSANTQRAVVTLTDTEMNIPDGTHRHSWKRTDDGSETILAYGNCVVERTTQA
jgi:hypothetical protein